MPAPARFGSSDAFSRFLFNKRYENGMAAFLECLRQLLEHARASEDDRVRREGGKPWEFGRYQCVWPAVRSIALYNG